MLGSHNSLTGYSCPWYLKLFNIFSKCQSKNIKQQVIAGVRFFDIRIKMEPNGRYCFAHGLARYKCPPLDYILKLLEAYSDELHTKIYFRVMLEYNHEPKHYDEIKQYLISFINYNMKGHINPYFCGAYAKWNYEEIMSGNIYLPITHKYSSCIGWKRFIHCIPYLYARKHNWSFRKEYNDVLASADSVLLLDFVEL